MSPVVRDEAARPVPQVLPAVSFVRADARVIDPLVRMVTAYHRFEGIRLSPARRHDAVVRLLASPELGEIWLIRLDDRPVGYVALCFGFTIEFGGRDAFIDEFWIEPTARGRGAGRAYIDFVIAEMRRRGLVALHLQVARRNAPARHLYRSAGFADRDGFEMVSLRLG